MQVSRHSLPRCGPLGDRRGATLVEYAVCVGVVALVAVVGVRVFGRSVRSKVEAHADCVAALDCGRGSAVNADSTEPFRFGAAAPPSVLQGAIPQAAPTAPPSSAATGAPSARPSFDGLLVTHEQAVYRPTVGDPFVKAATDSLDIQADDVEQGRIDDCYLMGAMAAVALRDPEAIRSAVQADSAGKYTVTLHEKRWWGMKAQRVTVEATFPTSVRRGTPIFAHSPDRARDRQELWPMLIEKAFAERRGSYHAIEEGHLGDALTAITGRPVVTRSHRDQATWDLTLDELADAADAGSAILTGSAGDDAGWTGPLYDNDTVVRNHTYYVTAVNRDKQTVSLRNPWGWSYGETTLSFDDYKRYFVSAVWTVPKHKKTGR